MVGPVTASSALFAVGVGRAGAAWRSRRGLVDPPAPRWREPLGSVARRHATRYMASCAIASTLATSLGIGHPYWAMVSAVVPLASRDLNAQLTRGAQRVIGTFAGLAVAAVLLSVELPTLALILVVVTLQACAELWVGRNYAIALVAITPLALLMVHLVAPAPTGILLVDRGVETVIGVAVGVALALLTPARHAD